MKMRTRILSMALIILVSLACAAIGAENPEVSLSAQGITIDKAMADLSQQTGVQIVCDTGVKAAVSGQFTSMKLEQLLDTITKANNLKWQKIYMLVKADSKPTLEEIKARAAALSAVAGTPLIVFDPATGKQKVFVEQDPTTPSVTPDKLGLKPIYLITAPKAAAEPVAKAGTEAQKRFESLTDERMRLLQGMSSEERQASFQQEMWYMMNLDQGARQMLFMDQFNARRNMSPQLREQYQQTMRDTFRSMRDQGLIPNGGWRGDGGGGGRRGGNNNNNNNQPRQQQR